MHDFEITLLTSPETILIKHLLLHGRDENRTEIMSILILMDT